MSSSLDPLIAFMDGADPWAPRVLYIDADDDLPNLLDRVEEAGTPAIVVLPEGARAVRGTVAARLLQRRATEAGIPLVVVTTDRATLAQLRAVHVPTASTVGDARRLLPMDEDDAPAGDAPASPPPTPPRGRPTAALEDAAHDAADGRDQRRAPTVLRPQVQPRRMPPAPARRDAVGAPSARATPPPAQVDDEADDAPVEGLLDAADDDANGDRTTPPTDATPAPSAQSAPGAAALTATDALPAVAQVRVVQTTRTPVPGAGGRRRRRLWAVAALLLVALLGVALWAFAFPEATITISYSAEDYNRAYQIAAGGSDAPVHTTHQDASGALDVPATGVTQVPDGRATGTVTFANPLDGYVSVPAGTIVATGDGVVFATLAAASVPRAQHSFSGTTNGQQSVQVRAVLAGPGSNVAANAISRIEGRLSGVLLVTNYNPTAGGTMRTVYSITRQDVAAAVTVLRSQLSARAQRTLAQRFSHSPARHVTGMHAGTPQVTSLTRNEKLYAHVALTVDVTMEYLHAQDVQRLAAAKGALDLSARNMALVPGSEHEQTAVTRAGDRFLIHIQVRAQVVPAIDVANVRGLLAGKTVAAARAFLDQSAHYGNWHYTLRTNPSWFGRMPQSVALIHITTLSAASST